MMMMMIKSGLSSSSSALLTPFLSPPLPRLFVARLIGDVLAAPLIAYDTSHPGFYSICRYRHAARATRSIRSTFAAAGGCAVRHRVYACTSSALSFESSCSAVAQAPSCAVHDRTCMLRSCRRMRSRHVHRNTATAKI